MKNNRLQNILLMFCSIALVLATAEVIMRFAWKMGGWVERPIYRRSFNPYLRYELVPGAKTTNISINSDGLRGPEYPVNKPKDTFRIIMLGDSETLSVMLAENQTLAAQLEAILNKHSLKTRYEVMNFGVEGYSTFQELEQLQTKGLKYNPDLVILNYVLNDPEPGEYYFEKNFLIRHSALARYFFFRIKKSAIKKERKKLKIKDEIDNYYYYHQPKYFNPLKGAVLEISDIAKEHDNKLVMVIFPTSSIMVKDFREKYPYWPLHKLIKTIPSDNIVFIDLIDEFNRLGLTPQQVSINYEYDESHKNAQALGVSAEYIYRVLKEQKIIPDNK
ncbi:MAG: hypothetical protein PHS09_03255 [Candidatus Omnitrophica bacterium]|nr:hypothetical protein [Candidatus Omnitrophota bacterium]